MGDTVGVCQRENGKPFTVNGAAHVFARAVKRAGIVTGDVTLHTLRHTAISRMIASGVDDYTVMAISGHSSTRMLARYTHPTEELKIDALNLPRMGTRWAQRPSSMPQEDMLSREIAEIIQELVVDGKGLEPSTSALRTRRSPS